MTDFITPSRIVPTINPELAVRLVEAAVKSKTEELEKAVASTLQCWAFPALIVSDNPPEPPHE